MDQATTSGQAGPTRRGVARYARPLLVIPVLLLVAVLAFATGTVLRTRVDSEASRQVNRGAAVTTAAQVETLQARLTKNPEDTESAVLLASVYLQRARETGDPAYYAKAEALLWQTLDRQPDNANAMAWMGAVQLSKHQFQSALDWGTRARSINPDLLAAFPVVIDANVELGRYAEATAAADEFIALRPDVRSYTRVSYLRELYGDHAGAIQAMELALDTTPEGTEPAAWTRVQLGNLHFNGGNLDAAQAEYDRTLRLLPDYPPALAGLGRVAAARGDSETSVNLLARAATRMPIPEYVIMLGDVHLLAGNAMLAEEQYALARVMTQLLAASGVNTDLELALFETDHLLAGRSSQDVVARARDAVALRPSIYGHDALAWALYKAGAHDEAQREIDRALALGTRDALLHFHAGMIALARGDDARAHQHLQTALEINPHFSILHSGAARTTLAALNDSTGQ